MYIRFCPDCNKELDYKHRKSFLHAERKKSKCKSCGLTGIKKAEGTKNKLSKIASAKKGEKNPFYGKNHSQETKEKIRDYNIGKKYSDKINKSKGRTGRVPSNKGIPIREETRKKISEKTKGKNNPMYGKPSPEGSGNGWSGWYKGRYFRSLKELSFIVYYLERFNFKWISGEKKEYRISYNSDGKRRNYYSDFIVDEKFLVEIKPKKLWNSKINILKREESIKFCRERGMIYKIIDPMKILSFEELESKINSGQLKFIKRYEQAFNNLRANSFRQNFTSKEI